MFRPRMRVWESFFVLGWNFCLSDTNATQPQLPVPNVVNTAWSVELNLFLSDTNDLLSECLSRIVSASHTTIDVDALMSEQ